MANRDDNGFSRGNGVIAAAIVLAAFIISWGWSGSQPRYQLAGSGSGIVRLDTDSGAMIACDMQACRQIEQPMRAKTFGPLRMEFGGDDNQARPKQVEKKP